MNVCHSVCLYVLYVCKGRTRKYVTSAGSHRVLFSQTTSLDPRRFASFVAGARGIRSPASYMVV